MPGTHAAKRALSALMAWLGKHELSTLVMLGSLAASVWVFAELADEVVERGTHAFDRRVLLALRESGDRANPIGPRWLEDTVRDVTALGATAVLTFLTLAVAGFLVLQRKGHAAILLIAAVLSGMLVSLGLKATFERPRPEFVAPDTYVITTSFPSGHSMMAAVTYLTLGSLVARVQSRKRIKAYVLILAAFLTFAVGASRVYLGVHWPTDVLAGWTVGAAWAILFWLIARWLQHRGQVEPDSGGGED